MTVTTNTTDRKALAKALADKLGTTAKYMGPPTFGYQVGDYIVDRNGNIEGENFEALRDFLQSIGCFPEEETELAGEQTEPETTAGELEITYIANKNSKKFHLPDCSSVADMKESNKWEFTGSRDELIELGYQPCKRCNP